MKNSPVRLALLVAALSFGATASARAQDDHKPGGLNKVAHDVSNTVKKAGRDTKAEVHRDASKTHNTLKDAGNDTKSVLKKTTGIHGSHNKHPGGLNKVAHDISNASKKAGQGRHQGGGKRHSWCLQQGRTGSEGRGQEAVAIQMATLS